MSDFHERFTLRQLPLPAKLVITCFLLAVGLGYFSALIQLHFQQATPGEFMPTPKNVIRHYHGEKPTPRLLSVIEADPSKWSSTAMAKAFFEKSEDWDRSDKDASRKKGEAERQLVAAWVKANAPKEAFEADAFPMPKECADLPEKFRDGEKAKIKSVLTERCFVCHQEGGEKEDVAFNSYDKMQTILLKAEPEGRISTTKLAQSTHAHLLSFAMLFSLTGLVFAFSSYPIWMRVLIAPICLIGQVADISCWWLARIDGPLGEMFALAIMGTGGIVGLGLLLQIILSVFNLYGAGGKTILILLFFGAAGGGFLAKTQFLDPYLAEEKKEAQKEPAKEENAE